MVVAVVAGIAVLLVFAVVFDAVARRRGRYRTPGEWQAASRRRKAHFRDVRERRQR